MLDHFNKRKVIEQRAKYLEASMLYTIVHDNFAQFLIDYNVVNVAFIYRQYFHKIIIFFEKYPNRNLIEILSEEFSTQYSDRILHDIILTNNRRIDPYLAYRQLVYLNGLIFLKTNIDEFVNSHEFVGDDFHLNNKLSIIMKDFNERFSSKYESETYDCNNIEDKFESIFSKEQKTLLSGLYDIDNVTNGGFNSGDLVICAARPGVGKTTFAINLLVNNIEKLNTENKKILWITPDMSPKYLYYRLIACAYDMDIIDVMKLDKHTLISYIKTFPIQITETYIYEKIEDFFKINYENICAVVIDYIQIIRYSNHSNKNLARHEQLGLMTIELKRLAKKYGITLFFLAQLNRGADFNGEESKVWIRDSGYLEQEADFIIILYKLTSNYRNAKLLFDVSKNRHGNLIKFQQDFNATRFRIE